MYIQRKLEKLILLALTQFPACLITGARQAGKSTLLKNLLPNYEYVTFDDPIIRQMAKEDPELFLNTYKTPVIIDKIQYVPELFSYIKIQIDKKRHKYGRFVLTGSQIFQIMEGVSESLAGRIAIFNLYPFSFEEIDTNVFDDDLVFKTCLKGFYPEFYINLKLEPSFWFSSYFATYIERDIRNIKAISDLSKFQSFISILATRNGQILNLSSISKECGITQPTCKSWLSILESTYIVYLLKPFYRNRKKRIIKSAKLYFVDTGLLCYLLGIDTPQRLLKASERGAIFENMIIIETIKRLSYQTKKVNCYFYRTQNGTEVDLIIEKATELIPYEIKFTKTISKNMASSINLFQKDHKTTKGFVLSLHKDKVLLYENIEAVHWNNILKT
jgi:predicted AAA+ superfamily ATPase